MAPRRNSRRSDRGGLLREAHRRLRARYGDLRWWPADSPLEVCVGAILVQNTSWAGAERAIANLRAAEVLGDAGAMLALPETRLAALIRPAGTFRVKARRLRSLLRWIEDRGGVDAALRGETAAIRASLLGVHGVGRETADAILLYAGGHPIFVVDAYTRRVVGRHRWLDAEAAYDDLRAAFEGALPRDPALFNRFHAEIVAVGKEHCRTKALCAGCPLEGMLPPGYPPRPA